MQIEQHVALSPLTTLGVGGNTRFFAVAQSIDDIREAVRYAAEYELPFLVMGEGSNVLIPDEGFSGVMIKNELHDISFKEDGNHVLVEAGAGESWDVLVKDVVSRELYGIENLSGIPGTVGATPVQNVGAYGMEVADVIEWVEVFDTTDGKVKQLTPSACRFAYRDSVFKRPEGKGYIITKVCLRLSKHGAPNLSYKDLKEYFAQNKVSPMLEHIRMAVLAIRSKKFPDLSKVGTAGSFFKNPAISRKHADELAHMYPDMPMFPVADQKVKIPLAWLLDRVCQVKGMRQGNVALFENQPLVLVTFPGATEKEIKAFAHDIAHRVYEKTHIRLEPEVTYVDNV